MMRQSKVSPRLSCVLFSLLTLTLGACASSDVTGIKVASQADIGKVTISDVEVAIQTPKPNPQLKVVLTEELKRTVPACSKGNNPHRLKVVVMEFEKQDVGKAIFIGDEIELEGRVELIDISTTEKVGEYYVERGFFWGGVIGAAMMANPERSLSRDFAKSICEEVFGVKLEAEP